MNRWLPRKWRIRQNLRWRGPLRFLLLAIREIFRPFMYWYVWQIFQRDVAHQPLPQPYGKEKFDVRVYVGKEEDLERARAEIFSMGELLPTDIDSRLNRGDAVAIAYAGNQPTGYMWLTFSSGMELAFGTTWTLRSNEALIYDSFVLPQWRGRGIQSCLNMAVNNYALTRGIVRTLASVSALNRQALRLPKHNDNAAVMTVILVRTRWPNWTFRKAIGAPLDSRFSVRS